jgi:hypothetical protein
LNINSADIMARPEHLALFGALKAVRGSRKETTLIFRRADETSTPYSVLLSSQIDGAKGRDKKYNEKNLFHNVLLCSLDLIAPWIDCCETGRSHCAVPSLA